MIRFGKSAQSLLSHKADFFENNDAVQAALEKFGTLYVQQPERTHCKCCHHPIGSTTFVKKGIRYSVCDRCGHLNGMHEDTDAFCQAVYTDEGGKAYARTYTAADEAQYRARVRDIYLPKAEFLQEALSNQNLAPANMKIADFGAGSGYFVSAMRDSGMMNSTGYEVSEVQVDLANRMIGEGAVERHELESAVFLAETVEAEVVSMIGVLEHVQKPREMLSALKENPNVRFFYMSVPLFSACVMLEAVFPKVMQRQLSAGHTHLFTEQSIDWICQEFGMKRVAEWWFGTDLVDLLRAVSVELSRSDDTRELVSYWQSAMIQTIDEAQLALDRRHLSSEVHMLLEFGT